jgi:Family of unknown function (DUF6308)
MDRHLSAFAETFRCWLERDEAEQDLNAYFAEPHQVSRGEPVYSGRYFERLGGGGDRATVWDRFTAEDLVAVQMLSIDVPAEISIALLHGELGRQVSHLLREIPTDVALGDPRALVHVSKDSPADQAWRLLEQQPGSGFVTAGKLMARKRPHLIPVYDSVVRCALEAPDQFWQILNSILADERTGIRRRLADLRATCRVPVEVGELRVLDVVVWKGHRESHQRTGCIAPGTTGLLGVT